jgi:hypothetical protein
MIEVVCVITEWAKRRGKSRLVFGWYRQRRSSPRPQAGSWEFLAFTIGIVCVITEWENVGEKAGSYSVDMDTGVPLGGHSVRDEHHIVVGYSVAGIFASSEHCVFDIARAFLAGLGLCANLFCRRRLALALPVMLRSNSPRRFCPWSPCFW